MTAPTIVFQDEPYEHPSGAFSFRIPEGWDISTEDDTSAILGIEQPYFALVGSAFVDAGFIHTRASFQEFIDDFSDSFISTFGDTYEIVDQVGDPNDKIFLSATFDGEDGPGNIDLLFMQRKTVVFVIYFITDSHEELVDTRDEILASYEVDPDAAIAIAPAPVPPTATPRPAPAGPSVPTGKAVFLFRNNTSVDFVIDVIGPTNTSQVIPPNSSHEFVLDPGDYIINGHSPGGDYYIDAYNFSVGTGQVFPLDLN